MSRPDWAEDMAAHRNEQFKPVRRLGLGNRARRVIELDERWNALRSIRKERAANPEMAAVPGGSSGLLVKRTKGIGSKDTFKEVTEYETDTALVNALLSTEEQAARELGQWNERISVEQTNKTYVGIPYMIHDVICRSKSADSAPSEQPALEAASPEPAKPETGPPAVSPPEPS
jgi:hypothetical protein